MPPAAGPSSRSRLAHFNKPVAPALPLPYARRQTATAAAPRSSPGPMAKLQHDLDGSNKYIAKRTDEPLPTHDGQHTAANGTLVAGGGSVSQTAVGLLVGHQTKDHSTEPSDPLRVSGKAVNGQTAREGSISKLGEPWTVPREHRKAYSHRVATVDAAPANAMPPSARAPLHYQTPQSCEPIDSVSIPVGGRIMASHGALLHPVNGPPAAHQEQASNGHIHFGTFHDSQSSSPAPVPSGTLAPPPPYMTGPDGRAAYVGHGSTGYPPPLMPYGADLMPGAKFDSYGPTTIGHRHMDSYIPHGGSFGPATHHNFADAQPPPLPPPPPPPPAHADDKLLYGQGQPITLAEGGSAPVDDACGEKVSDRMMPPPEYARMMAHQPHPLSMMTHEDNGDGLLVYVQQQFASPELADCTLELVYDKDKARPVRIPGHRLMFARSPTLAALLRDLALRSTPLEAGSAKTLRIQSDGRWVRSDSFYMAVQRLYGLPLLPVPPPPARADGGEVTELGSARERFEFALSYAAAGHLLGLGPVARRGCDVAAQLLSWQTLEKGLEFALDGYRDGGNYESFGQGEASRAMLGASMTFMMHYLPPNFELDTCVKEAEPWGRLPRYDLQDTKPVTTGQEGVSTGPGTISREPSVVLGRGNCRRSLLLGKIQFGDLSLSEDSETASEPGAARPLRREGRDGALTEVEAILSRVLLSLPFRQVKMVLESAGLGHAGGWSDGRARMRLAKRVVDARERRRREALKALTTGRVDGAEAILAGVGRPSPGEMGRWSALEWEEELAGDADGDGSRFTMGRCWAPMTRRRASGAAEVGYP